MGRITLWGSPDFKGYAFTATHSIADLRDIGGRGLFGTGNWNDEITSFIVEEGQWQFFEHVGYGGIASIVFGPGGINQGKYRDTRDFGFPADTASSLRLL